jgi:mRNA-degrading endonuclease RelE of RelBE toxin-antitoxin system
MTAMGRKKQVNALSKCYSLKVSEELFNSIQSLQKTDKAKFNTLVRELANRFIIKVYQNNTADNTEKIKVNQNNSVKITENKSLPKKKKVKVVEKSMFEQVMAEQAEEESKHSINRLFEVEQ